MKKIIKEILDSDFIISEGKQHKLIFTNDKLKIEEIDIDVEPIIDAIETTIHNMVDAKQLTYNGLRNGLDVEFIEKIISVRVDLNESEEK